MIATYPPLNHAPFTTRMARSNPRPVGRPKKTIGENVDREHSIGFTPSMYREVEDLVDKLSRETRRQISFPEVVRQAVQLRLDNESGVNVHTGTDLTRLPYLGAVPCGPLAEAVAEAGTFAVNQDIVDEIEPGDGDFWVRADGHSVHELGIHHNMMCLVTPYGRRFVGRGDICAIQITTDDEIVTGTIKQYDGERNGKKCFVDGKGNDYELPENTVRVEILGEVTSVIGKLNSK